MQSDISSPLRGTEFKTLIRPLLRWWWLLLLAPLLSAGVAYNLLQRNPQYYQARTLLNIGPTVEQIDVIISPVLFSLGYTYSQIIQTDEFLAQVVTDSKTNLTVAEIKRLLVVYYKNVTPFLEMQFVDTNPDRAVLILNSINKVLVLYTPKITELERKNRNVLLKIWQTEIEKKLELNQTEYTAISLKVANERTTFTEERLLLNRAVALRIEIENQTQQIQAFNKSIVKLEVNQVSVLEKPLLIASNLGPQPRWAVITLGAISLCLTIFTIYVLERSSKQVHSVTQVEMIFNLPVVLNTKKSAKALASQTDLLAAELVAKYLDTSGLPYPNEVKLLVLYEAHTQQPARVYQSLADSLNRLGLVTVIQDNLVSRVVFQKYPPLEDKSRVALAEKEEWHLICQPFPSSLRQLTLLCKQCNGILVLCSLKTSPKKNLSEMNSFINTVKIPCAGVGLCKP
jgi:capsular polysaccharide biosynthesis protein